MFISKAEKNAIETRIKNLEIIVRDMSISMFHLKKAYGKTTPNSGWSPKMRAKQSELMRQRWAEKKKEK